MTLPTVSELVRGLEPVTRDPFMDGLDTVAPHPGAARELLDRHQVTNVRSALADVAPVASLVGNSRSATRERRFRVRPDRARAAGAVAVAPGR